MFAADEPGRSAACTSRDLPAGSRGPISPEGIELRRGCAGSISPDGRFVAASARTASRISIRLDGRVRVPIPGLEAGEFPVRWSAGRTSRSIVAGREGSSRRGLPT